MAIGASRHDAGELGKSTKRARSRSKRGVRQAEVDRAIAAAEQAGLKSYRIELATDGTISIVVGMPPE